MTLFSYLPIPLAQAALLFIQFHFTEQNHLLRFIIIVAGGSADGEDVQQYFIKEKNNQLGLSWHVDHCLAEEKLS